ncbi:hypothetical protein P3W24_06745 [Luteibacter sp. PPL201]|uniref:Uncharacterized protein n=1 Tax=Luteibacter sahnii TaxID=3021977 RepID=A0ABT6B9A6_9GAMM
MPSPRVQLDFDVLSRVAGILDKRLLEGGRSKGGELSGTAFVLLDADDSAVICNSLSDAMLDLRWHIRHRLKEKGPGAFNTAISQGLVTFGEFALVAGEAATELTEMKEQNHLDNAVPSAGTVPSSPPRL